MTGPEHYREAEEWLGHAAAIYRAGHPDEQAAGQLAVAIAAGHAQLAQVAAVVELDAVEGPGGGSATGRWVDESGRWAAVLVSDEEASADE